MRDLGIRKWDVSYARQKSIADGANYFRFRDLETGVQVHVRQILSDPEFQAVSSQHEPNCFIHGEGVKDHLEIECGLKIAAVNGQTIGYFYPPTEWPEDEFTIVQEFPRSTAWRFCMKLDTGHIRCLNEETQVLNLSDDLRGPARIHWTDGAPHIHHRGSLYLDGSGTMHTALPRAMQAQCVQPEEVHA